MDRTDRPCGCIKVDFRLTSFAERRDLINKYKNGRILLAEKVETNEEFETAIQQGYQLFQGYFFCKPKILRTKALGSLNPQHLRLLKILGNPNLDFHEVEELVKTDPALCLRLLRYLNSAAFGFQAEIRSILQALMLLGETELRKWLFLMSAMIIGQKNPELVKVALVRARFAELLGGQSRQPTSLLFLLGLLSLVDAMLGIPFESVAEMLAMPAELRSALMGKRGPLRDSLELVLAYERGDWEQCNRLAEKCAVPVTSMARKYIEALIWAESVMQIRSSIEP